MSSDDSTTENLELHSEGTQTPIGELFSVDRALLSRHDDDINTHKTQLAEFNVKISELVRSYEDITRINKNNIQKDTRLKNTLWWILLFTPFVLLGFCVLGFYVSGGKEQISKALQYTIYVLGIGGIISYILILIRTMNYNDRIKKIEDERYKEK